MVFGLFKDYTKIAAEEIDREFNEFENFFKDKKNKITAQDFKKNYSKKLFFRKVKCDMGIRDFGYEFALSIKDNLVPFWFYAWFKKGKFDGFEFSCIDEKFYNIEGYLGTDVKQRHICVIDKGGIAMYGGSKALKKKLVKEFRFKDDKGTFVDQGNLL